MKALEATAEIFSKEISPVEIKTWTVILAPHADGAISWSFETWNRNGRFFPKPSEILELLHAYGSSEVNQVQYCGQCQDGWVEVNPDSKPSDREVRRCDCVTAAVSAGKIPVDRCDAECKSRHGHGYHWNDVRWLFKRYQRELAVNPKANPEDFFEELDAKRQGGAPQWRVGGVAAHDWQNQPITDEDIPF